jgi:hypothetical protein
MSQTYSRYSAHDFERRWQRRLGTPPQRAIDDFSPLHVKVTHRFRAPNRYSWELRPATGLPVEESRVQFACATSTAKNLMRSPPHSAFASATQ